MFWGLSISLCWGFVTGCYALVFTLSALGFSSFPSKKPIFIVLIYVLIAVFVSILAAAAVAFLVERVAYKPLRKRNALIWHF